LTYYNSQHRKLNDELVFITQFEKLIDVRVRGFVQDFCYFQNMGLEKFMTIFKKPSMFCMEVHRKPPSGNNSPPPNERHFYKMDFELAKCYDTSAGVGIKGRKLPEKKKTKGLNIWWILVAGIVVAFLLSRIPRMIHAGADALLRPETKTQAQLAMSKETPGVVHVDKKAKVPTSEHSNAPRGTSPPPLYEVTGYVIRGSSLSVTMSNGDVLTEVDGLLQRVERGRVKIRGQWYTLKPNKNARSTPIVEKKDLTQPDSPALSSHGNEETSQTSGDSDTARSERPGEYTFDKSYLGDSRSFQDSRQKTQPDRLSVGDRGWSQKSKNRRSGQ